MKAFYGSRFSTNMTKTPEGFLICHNVPIARTGWYEYLASELGLEGNQDEVIKVYRSPQEVFSKEAISSFEGKPVTDEHPPDFLTPNNSKIFVKGTTQNVRQDKNEDDLLVADLIIYDSILIDEILQGKREVSCGYGCNYLDNKDGTYSQVKICGNHVAVVEAGRAGSRVMIKDSIKKNKKEGVKNMSKNKISKNFLTALGLKHFLDDAEPDDMEKAIDEIKSEENVKDEETQEKLVSNDDENEMVAMNKKLDQVIELLKGMITSKDKQPEDVIDEMIGTLEENKESNVADEEESVTIPAEEIENKTSQEILPNKDSSAMLMALKVIKPIIANMSNSVEKKKVCDSLMNQFKKYNTKNTNNGYTQIIKSQRYNTAKQKAKDAKLKADEMIGENIKRKFNPHYKEVK